MRRRLHHELPSSIQGRGKIGNRDGRSGNKSKAIIYDSTSLDREGFKIDLVISLGG
ncbi:hypothetical protein HMPREF9440_01080 [Sutterella parvirubra YIT 11816]|uniref:Uncharacterized protein n=1 Tax=Sutterella parvirubra YIT 11816 TaxID=762967 RepID=H3KEB5_9BURK|nr:hypothetical protein HMPREF9440_01080 [Sutterella parvirubra YIT 11816]